MKCPKCDQDMETGVISSQSGIYWTMKPAIMAYYGGAPLNGPPHIPKSPYLEASRCKNCRLVVANYLEPDKDRNIFENKKTDVSYPTFTFPLPEDKKGEEYFD